MRFFWSLLPFLVHALAEQGDGLAPNSSYLIFNEINSAMRQWGSSLNHNGMACFFATSPSGLELYAGSAHKSPRSGMGWFSFEPEYAEEMSPGWANLSSKPSILRGRTKATAALSIPPMGQGFLHTYRTKHSLRLLYLDGTAAEISNRGTFDFQDRVLLSTASVGGGANATFDVQDDVERCRRLCRLAKDSWDDRIDGFIRNVWGFEVLLCASQDHLEPVRILRAEPKRKVTHPFRGTLGLEFYQAIAARNDGIGAHRVTLDFNDYVTLFDSPEAVFFDHDGYPRANASNSRIPQLQKSIKDMVLRDHGSNAFDWQAIGDMIILRYADKVEFLLSIKNLQDLNRHAEKSLRPFIDYDQRDKLAEIGRCERHFLPPEDRRSPEVRARSILQSVQRDVCQTLLSVSSTRSLVRAIGMLDALQSRLSWTTWKRCKGCAANEVCYVPIVPYGTKANFIHPKCIAHPSNLGTSYWGDL